MRLAGARENYVTTTGGPEQSLAEPAPADTSTADSIRVERVADGDDIVIEPDSPLPPDRSRRLIVGGVVAVLLLAGIVTAITSLARTRHGSTRVQSLAKAQLPDPRPPVARVVKPATKPKTAGPKTAQPKTNVENTTPVEIAPPVSIATPPTAAIAPPPPAVTAPPVATPPVATPTVATPPVESASVLRWTATPASLTVKGGGQAGVTVNVANPTKGTVTLGTPLSCAPILRGPHGAEIGSAICEQLAQIMAPHSQLTQHFTIYATDTASTSGQPLPPGAYTATFENLFKIKVNVTAR
jgi:hypothetical protein